MYSWIRSYKDEHDIAKIKLNNETPEQARLKAELEKATAFFDLKENAGTRGIKDYPLHENNVRISRRKIGKVLAILGLKVKTQKNFKKQSTATVNDPRIMSNILNRYFEVSYDMPLLHTIFSHVFKD